MDGPNVSKAFEDKLLNCLKEDNETEFLKLLTCLLHKVHNAFHTELKEFSFDFNTFAVAVHSFFSVIKCDEGESLKVSGNNRFGCSIYYKTFIYKFSYFKICCSAIVRTMEKPK